MIGADIPQIVQYIAWLIALVELIIGLYVLIINYRSTVNQHIALFLLVTAISTFAIGSLARAVDAGQARLPSIVEAAAGPVIQPLLFLTTVAVLRPGLFKGRWRWWRWIPIIFALLPALLTFTDVVFNTRLFYSGMPASSYTGGYLPVRGFSTGLFGLTLTTINFGLFATLNLAFLGYIAVAKGDTSKELKRLAIILLVASILSFLADALLSRIIMQPVPTLFSSVLLLSAYAYAAFQRSISESVTVAAGQPAESFRGRLQFRFTALVLVISLPLLAAMALFLTDLARRQLEQDAVQQLEYLNSTLSTNLNIWVDYNNKALQNLANNPALSTMDPAQQRPLLQAMIASYPLMYLVSTTDLNGMNVARSDSESNRDYSDREWFQKSAQGAPVTYQTLRGRTTGQPALVAAMPIHDPEGGIVGVVMFATDLDDVSQQVNTIRIGQKGYAFVIDQNNLLIAHPDPLLTSELTNMTSNPAVRILRAGTTGRIRYVDGGGNAWRAHISQLPNGWGVIVQQPEAELFAPILAFQRLAILVAALGAIILGVLAGVTIRQGIQPIRSLTQVARTVAAGKLDTQAPVLSDDELGLLATTFNSMTSELSQLVSGLEDRVAERTQALERRATQLQTTIEISREAGSIRDLYTLLDHSVNLISERFGFYHAGIFMLDNPTTSSERSTRYVVLRAASSEGGRRMLERGHKLRVGQVGIVGYVAGSGQPRVALDVGQDAVFFNNPDLPLTRSEAALPLIVQNNVIGVLDVQSTEADAFSREDLDLLLVLAGQIALAIENSRLLSASRQAYQELEAILGRQTRESWKQHLAARSLGYRFGRGEFIPLPSTGPADREAVGGNGRFGDEEKTSESTLENGYSKYIPIELRGQHVGSLVLRRPPDAGTWTMQEEELIQKTMSQVALALENARLLEQIQQRADQEETLNQIVARTQASLNLETVIKAAVQEIGQTLNIARVQILLNPPLEGSEEDALARGELTR